MIIIQFDRRNQFFLDCCELHHVKIAREKIALSHRHSDWLNSWGNQFSSLLIIHQVKTKKITIVKEVRIPGLN